MRRIMKIVTVAAVAAGVLAPVQPAAASTPQAWAALEKKIATRCIAKSGLSRARIMPGKLGFSDALGIEVRMVRGLDRRGRQVTMACGYQRRTGLAEVQEAPVWDRR